MLPDELKEEDTFLVRGLRRVYTPAVEFALANRVVTLGGMGALLLVTVLAAGSLGTEFLPHLEEGNFWIRATMPGSISLEEGDGYVNRMRGVIKSYPEVQTVVSQHGRPDDGTDATGFFNAEFFVPLKPFGTWPGHTTKETLTEQLSGELERRFPGVEFNFFQTIEDNVEEAASGVKGANSVKIFGPDLETLQATADRIGAVMKTVPGVADLQVLSALGQPTVRIDVDRVRASRYGLQPGDINAVVAAAVGGQAAGNLYEGGSDRNFPLLVRLSAEHRSSLDDIRNLMIAAPATAVNGTGVVQVPLSAVADVKLVSGAAFVYREQQSRYIPIEFSVRGRDLGGTVSAAQAAIARHVQLPGGYHLEWVGELGELTSALARRLEVAIPISLALIAFLLFINFSSMADTLLALSVMPMAMVGGILALSLTGTALSVSAAIGFIGLFGISVMNGIIVLSSFNHLTSGGLECAEALRPRLRHPAAPRGHDLLRRLRGPLARRPVPRHRLPGAAAPGAGGGRRHPAGPGADPAGAAGPDRPLLPRRPPAHGRDRRPRRRTRERAHEPAAPHGGRDRPHPAVGPAHRLRGGAGLPPPRPACARRRLRLRPDPAEDRGRPRRPAGRRRPDPGLWRRPARPVVEPVPQRRTRPAGGRGAARQPGPGLRPRKPEGRPGVAARAARRPAAHRRDQRPGQPGRRTATPCPPTLNAPTSMFSLYTVQLAIAYSPDVFGGVRRGVETLRRPGRASSATSWKPAI